MKCHLIRNSLDIENQFEKVLDSFPRHLVDGEDQLKFSEFGAYLIRPAGEMNNQLSHLLFPEVVIAVPDSDRSLTSHATTSFPQVRLLSDSQTNELFLKVIGHSVTDDSHIQMNALILSSDDFFLSSDLWDSIANEDRDEMSRNGFGPGMSFEEWGEAINKCQSHVDPILHPRDGKPPVRLRELPMLIARRGCVGTNGGFNQMPEFMMHALSINKFVYDESDPEILHEIGDIHVHSLVNAMTPLQQAVADIVGEEVIRRNPSVPDVHHQRANRAIFKEVCFVHGAPLIDTMRSFAGILTVDALGRVTGARYLDYYEVDLDKLADLNDKAWDSMHKSSRADPYIIAQHYKYLDSVTTENFGTDEVSPHVGLPI